jgi:hypothetical protein
MLRRVELPGFKAWLQKALTLLTAQHYTPLLLQKRDPSLFFQKMHTHNNGHDTGSAVKIANKNPTLSATYYAT